MFPQPPELSFVIPCFNEGRVLPLLRRRLIESLSRLNLTWEVILWDDGSQDDTFQQLAAMHAADPRFKVIAFLRNFGHQCAVFAGLSRAMGDFVPVLDADLQDPPEFVATCVAKLKEGYDVVYAVRRDRKDSLFKQVTAAAFYRLLKGIAEVEIPLDAGDFCVMRQCVVAVLRTMPEHEIFVRGLRAWSGFRQIGVKYERAARAAGETKYPLRKMVKFALNGVFAFSTLPLRLAIYLGFAGFAGSLGGSALHFFQGRGSHVRVPVFGTVAPENEITIEFWQRTRLVQQQSSFSLYPNADGNRINAQVPFADGVMYWDFGNIYGHRDDTSFYKG